MHDLTPFQIKIARRIDEIPPEDWDIFFGSYIENHAFFKALDDANFPEFQFSYVVVYSKGKAVGAFSTFLMSFPLDFATDGPLKGLMAFLKKLMPRLMAPKILICGMPINVGRIGILQEEASVMAALTKTVEQLAKEQEACIIAYKDFTEEGKVLLNKYLNKDFFCLDSFPSTDMQLNFKDFDAYFNTLSPVTRNGIKRNFKKVDAKGGIRLDIVSSLDEKTLTDVHALYLQTYAKNEMSVEKLTPDFFKAMQRHMPQETKFFLWHIDGKLASFAFCLVRNGHFIDYYLGFDYAKAVDYYLYYVRFRDLMRWCLANGIKTYEMGPTTYEPKRRLGFNLVWLYIYVKHRNKWINPLFKLLCIFIKPSNFDPIFKLKPKAV